MSFFKNRTKKQITQYTAIIWSVSFVLSLLNKSNLWMTVLYGITATSFIISWYAQRNDN